MKKLFKIASALFLSILIIAGLSACGQKPVSEEERVQAEAVADNLLEGIEKRDYDVFSADFDANMLSAMKENDFRALTGLFDETIGAYRSRDLVECRRILNAGTKLIYLSYSALFEKESGDVTIHLYLSEKDGTFFISGFSYDSPALRATLTDDEKSGK